MNVTELRTAEALRELAAAAAPAVVVPPDLAARVLERLEPPVPVNRKRLAAGATMLGVVAAVAAAALTGNGEYRKWTQPSAAMQPTIGVSQTVLVGKHLEPLHGDVVLLRTSNGTDEFEMLGRVAGLPGDTVACPAGPGGSCSAVVVSGRALREPWVVTPTAPFPATEVRRGEVFVLGDARNAAVDSRLLGPQRLENALGVVVARFNDSGRREAVPGAPVRPLPDGGIPVDPAEPVPPASSR